MEIRLNHVNTYDIAINRVFKDIVNYDDLIKNIIDFGKDRGKVGSVKYNDALGMAMEVYTEFFFKKYGTSANPLLGVKCIEDTSRNKYQTGYDFTYEDFNGLPAFLQVKFRSNPSHKFSRIELGSFVSKSDELDIPKERRILFTNLDNSISFFHTEYSGGKNQMRIIDRSVQEEFLDRDPSFWSELLSSVNLSLTSNVQFIPTYVSRDHQVRMEEAQERVLNLEYERGKIIASTGAGKTLVIYKGVQSGFFNHNFLIEVVVAPTIDLLRQHHEYFEQFGIFHKDNINVIHFRTGEESRTDQHFEYQQSTNLDKLSINNKTLIFVTYASEENLFNSLKEKGITVDCTFWDEFHHTVKQKESYKEHLLSLPSSRNIFYSASERRGRVLCSFDDSVYGPTLENVPYKELREKAILVPKIIIKPILVSGNIQSLKNIMKKSAKDNDFNLKDAVKETAGIIIARQNMMSTYGKCNLVSFSKAVPICKEIVKNEKIRHNFGELLNAVYADVPGKDRKKIFDQVKLSLDSVLLQYSIVKEGIDINPFNSVVLSREMDVIGIQQGIGRITRANPIDTENFKNGKLSLDSPEGWLKYEAVVYILISQDDNDLLDFKDRVKDIVRKLQGSGFDKDDYEFQEILEARTGVDKEMLDWMATNTSILKFNILEDESIQNIISQSYIDIERDDEEIEVDFEKRQIDEHYANTKTFSELLLKFSKKPVLLVSKVVLNNIVHL